MHCALLSHGKEHALTHTPSCGRRSAISETYRLYASVYDLLRERKLERWQAGMCGRGEPLRTVGVMEPHCGYDSSSRKRTCVETDRIVYQRTNETILLCD